MVRMLVPSALALVLPLGALLGGACGGSTVTGAGDGGASSNGAADAALDAAATVDGAACVTIDPGSFSHICAADLDCTTIPNGTLCTGGCACVVTSIATIDLPKFTAATAAIQTLACPCPYPGTPRCVRGGCTLCMLGPGSPPGCPDGG